MQHPDIVPLIFSHLSPEDLFSASNVCQDLQEPALKELLSRPIIFENFTQVDRWYDLMHARLGESWPVHIRHLAFYFHYEPEPESETTMQHIRDIFLHATLLRKLYIHRADHLLRPESGIPMAISELEHLEYLYIETEEADDDTAVQPVVEELLARMQSTLTFLVLKPSHSTGDWTYEDLPRILGPHLHRLTELTLGSPEYLTDEVQSPTLRVLTTSLREGSPTPRQLYESFPNLHTLILADCSRYFLLEDEDEATELTRAGRMADQAGGHVWPSLVCVQGDVAQLYLLGLACPIFRLELLRCRPEVHNAAVELVRSASPRYLTLHTSCFARRRGDSSPNVESLLTQGSSGRQYVPHLTMNIGAEWVNWPQTVDFAVCHDPLLDRVNE